MEIDAGEIRRAGRLFGCTGGMFAALFLGFMGCACGGFFAGVAGDTTMGLVAPLACGLGEQMEYRCQGRSYTKPGECVPEVTCTAADGTVTDRTGRAMLAVVGSGFLLVFLPTALLFGLVGWFAPGRLAARLARRRGGRTAEPRPDPIE